MQIWVRFIQNNGETQVIKRSLIFTGKFDMASRYGSLQTTRLNEQTHRCKRTQAFRMGIGWQLAQMCLQWQECPIERNQNLDTHAAPSSQ